MSNDGAKVLFGLDNSDRWLIRRLIRLEFFWLCGIAKGEVVRLDNVVGPRLIKDNAQLSAVEIFLSESMEYPFLDAINSLPTLHIFAD